MKINPGSLRLAFFLITILLILIILSAIVPQQDSASGQIVDWQQLLGSKIAIIEKLGLDRIYYSPFFFSVLTLLAFSLLWANIKRIRRVYKSRELTHRARYLGSVIFHFSLVMIIGGIITNYLYKYEGVFALTEGQQVSDRAEDYFREFKGPLCPEEYGRFSLKLNNLDSLSPITGRPAEAARISVWSNQLSPVDTFTILTNRSFQFNGLEFHYGLVKGYSPEIIVVDSAGTRLMSSFVRLATQEVEGKPLYFDYIFIPFTDLKLSIKLLSAREGTSRLNFAITAENNGKKLYEGMVVTGETIRFEDYELIIPRVRTWCYINVVKSPYLSVIFGGFWLGLVGISLNLISRIVRWGK